MEQPFKVLSTFTIPGSIVDSDLEKLPEDLVEITIQFDDTYGCEF